MARINIILPGKFAYSTQIKLRITDINYGGHLAHDSILSITHEARVRFLESLGYTEGNIEGPGLILSDADLVYKSEACYGRTLLVEIAVTDLSKYGCDLTYKLSDKKNLIAIDRANAEIVFSD